MIQLAASLVMFCSIGFVDDFLSIRRGKNLGLTPTQKLVGQFVMAALVVTTLSSSDEILSSPSTASLGLHVPWMFEKIAGIVAGTIYIVALSNAVNLSDGLDGLSSSLIIPAAIAVGYLAMGHSISTALMCSVIGGSVLGFLWCNSHPAKVIMGDTGSLPLGGMLATLSLTGNCVIGAVVATMPIWVIMLSVVAQVAVFKYRKYKHGVEYSKTHRLILRAPLHHHFEELKVPETRIVARFFVVSCVCSALAMLFR